MNRTRGFRGPFARWPRASDATLAVLLFLLAVFVTEGAADAPRIRAIDEVPPLTLAAYAVAAAAMWWRRRRPVAVLGVALAGWLIALPTHDSNVGGITIFALYATGRYAGRSRPSLAALAAASAVLVVDGLVLRTPWAETVFGVGFFFVFWYAGLRMASREERAAQRRRQRAAEARRIVTEERTHIARELHDVVAHRVSMMTVQAGAAQAVAAAHPERAREAMAAVEQAGRQALDELRHLLGVLRPESDGSGLGPQPGLADLPRLVAQLRDAGLAIEVTDGLSAALPTRVQLSVYRIVQEALTNVLKHGGPGTRTEVRLGDDGTDVTVEVLDHGAPGSARPQPPGHGIIGMRERATLLGGTLETGPRPEGGFRVAVRFPLTARSGD